MKVLFASDIHGSAYYTEKILERFEASGAGKLILLGDILYHGPRNDLPEGHAPKKVFAMLNGYAEKIIAVRGNCDAEIDQLMLSFPLLGPCATVVVDGVRLFLSHGHLWGPDEQLPPLSIGTIVATGHTHVPTIQRFDGHWCFNPGSISIPKGGSEASYALLDGRALSLRRLADGEPYRTETLEE